MRRLLRRLAWLLGALVVLLANVIAGGYLYLRTDHARDHLLTLGLRRLAPLLAGSMTVGRSTGDLTRGLVFYDVVVLDADGELAIRADRVELRYALFALAIGRVQVDYLGLSGATLVSRRLADGRDNLAALGYQQGRTPGAKPTAAPVSPVAVTLAELDLELRFVRLPSGVALADAPPSNDLRARIHARADLTRALTLSVEELTAAITTPARGRLSVRGRASLGATKALHDVALHLEADARDLRRHVPGLDVRGPIVVTAHADGAIKDLLLRLAVHTSAPALDLVARGRLLAHRIDVALLSLDAPGATLKASGSYAFDRTGSATIHARSTDLGALRVFGAPSLAGRVKLDGTVHHDAQRTEIKLDGDADGLVFLETRVRRAELHVDTLGLAGHARVQVAGLRRRALVIDTLKLVADGTNKSLRATAQAVGPEGLALDLSLAGAPLVFDGHVLGLEATLAQLRFRAGGTPWTQVRTAHLSADFDAASYALTRLALVNEAQRITLEGRFANGALEDVFVDVKHFDLSELAAAISPGHVLPHTDVNGEIEARGALDNPTASARITAEIFGRGQDDLIRATATADAKLANRRLGGKVFVTIGGQNASLKVDMPLPLAPAQPIDVAFDASVLLSPTFADLLVPKLIQSQPLFMYALGAKVTAQGTLTGTTSDPRMNASARIARWAAAGSHGDVGLSLEYAARQLGVSLRLVLSSLPGGGGQGGGVVQATAKLRADLTRVLTGGAGQLLDGEEPIQADLVLTHVGLDHVPFAAFHFIPPVQHGWIDGKAQLAGTRANPKLSAELTATGLVAGGVSDIDLVTSGRLQGGAATGDLRVSVHGSEAFRLHGSLDAGHDRRPGKAALLRAPLAVSLDVLGFDLARLGIVKGLDGVLRGKAELTGTLQRPHGKADFQVGGLRLGDTRFTSSSLEARVGDAGLRGKLSGEQGPSARFSLDGVVPWAADAPLEARLQASRFALDFGSETLPYVRLLRGLLDADVRVGGTRASPKLNGTLALARGELRVPFTAMSYRDIDATLAFAGDAIAITSLRLASGTSGQVVATGALTHHHRVATAMSAQMTLRHFPMQHGGVGMLLDAELALAGKRDARGVLAGTIDVRRGSAQLPDFQTMHDLLPTASLEDVTVASPPLMPGRGDDVAARPAPAVRGPRIGAMLEGPFVIRGADMSATARGNLLVDLSGPEPVLRGTVALDPHGWVELFGKRYDLERTRLRFDGAADPVLDLRISRPYASAVIGADVSGPSTAPRLTFWSVPPVYDQTQIVSIMVAGNPSINGISARGLELKAFGVVSNLVATAIRKNFLASLPINVFRFDADQSRSPSPQGSQVELGKYLTESLYVGYVFQIGAERVGIRRTNRNEARMEYQVAPSLKLEAKGGDAGVGGVDLFWTWRP